jgi:aminoglycoside phosphotransferase (APT) family kinase protein
MRIASGVRIGWLDLPAEVRGAVEAILGGEVVDAVSQPGGFSPGTADRVRTAAGARAFVKAVSPAQNEVSPRLHRREAQVTAALPSTAPAPSLLGYHDDGTWVALVLQDIEGQHPATPWVRHELESVLATLEDFALVATPSPIADIPTAAKSFGHDFAGWHRVAANPPADLRPWAAQHLGDLCALADRSVAALSGATLVHGDLRADNLLLSQDGSVTLVDWPWACRGPAWLDRVLLLINVLLHGGHDAGAIVNRCAASAKADPADLVAVLAAAAGFFIDAARQPAPAGLPTVRDFQRAQGEAVLAWLQDASSNFR